MVRIWVTFRPHIVRSPGLAPGPIAVTPCREAIVREESDEIRGARLVPLGRDLRLLRSIASSVKKRWNRGMTWLVNGV
jgi:hypothetical protein